MLTYELLLRTLSGLLLMAILGFIFFIFPPWAFSMFLAIIAITIAFYEIPPLHTDLQVKIVLTLGYVFVPFLLIIYLNQNSQYHQLILYLFISVFANDTGAYIVGKLCGRTLLVPTISPKKTWEGFVGGSIAAIFSLYALAQWYSHSSTPFLFFVLFGITIASCATLGDIFESWLKRQAHLKDTGTLLPGHGGLLDRFDSIIFVGTFFYIYKEIITNILTG